MQTEIRYHLLKRKIRGKVVYHAAFVSPIKAENGKYPYQLIKSTKQSSRVAADRQVQKWLADGMLFASTDDLRTFLTTFWDYDSSEYLRSLRVEQGRRISRDHVTNSLRWLVDYFLPWADAHGIRKLNQLTMQNLTLWRNDLVDGLIQPPAGRAHSRRDPGVSARLSPVSVNKVRQSLKTALQWATEQGSLPLNPMANVKRVGEAGASTEKRPFELSELSGLFSVAWKDSRAKVAAMFALTSGARLGEVRGLQIRNLHLDEGYVDIVTSWIDGHGMTVPKWGNGRLGVGLGSVVCQELQKLIAENPFGADPDNLVFFGTSPLVPMPAATIQKGLKMAIATAGLGTDRSFHSLRHTYASHARGRVSDVTIMHSLGHSSIKMTDHYSHLTDEGRTELKRFSNFLLPLLPGSD